MTEAWKWLQANAPGGQLDSENWAQENFPEEEPCWDLNTESGKKPAGEVSTGPPTGGKSQG